MYYTLDGLLAGILIVGITVLLLQNSYYEPKVEQRNFMSQDILNALAEIQISEISTEFIQNEITTQNINNTNITALEQIGQYWATNQTEKANSLFSDLLNLNQTQTKAIKLTIENEEIYSTTTTEAKNIISTQRMIAGISKGAPLSGYSSSAYLKKIQNKKSIAYAYIGGFIGQGNISIRTETLPDDINTTNIETLNLQGDFGTNFTLQINNQECNATTTQQKFIPQTTIGEVDQWNLTQCTNTIKPGTNNITINFEQDDISNQYAAGGMLKIIYRTNTLLENLSRGTRQYNFPGIIGVANLYDSFYVPGNLTNITVALHFKSTEQTFFTIGERIIEINATGTDQWTTLTDDYLKNQENLNYEQLSLNTIPLRFASYNATTETVSSGDADVILITDFSGSMKKAVDSWSQGTGLTDCEQLYDYPDARKTHLARCLDNEVVDTIMNYTGNRLWPVFIYNNKIEYYNNPEDKEAIQGYISNFGPQGKGETCLSCALNKAYDILNTYSNENRSKFIIFMTDGAPTHCADGSCESTSTNYGTQTCVGFCDTSGASGCKDDEMTGCQLTDLSCEEAENNTIYSANRINTNINATIYTVGFGLIQECTRASNLIKDIANQTNGTYQHSTNVTELRLIYQNISTEILNKVQQTNQTISVKGNITYSNLYNDSHINFTYTPITTTNTQGMISITLETQLENCTNEIEIPAGLTIEDAKVTSYSGTHWTDNVTVNNQTAFNLINYYTPYYRLGDAFIIQVPVNMLNTGLNNITIETGDSPTNRTGCSTNNSFIYTGYVPSVTSRSEVTENLEGCTWTIKFEDGQIDTLSVPTEYTGTKTCSYQPGNITYDTKDTYDTAVYQLLKQLDVDEDGEALVNMNKFDLEITTTTIGGIPYLWGPSLLKIEIHD